MAGYLQIKYMSIHSVKAPVRRHLEDKSSWIRRKSNILQSTLCICGAWICTTILKFHRFALFTPMPYSTKKNVFNMITLRLSSYFIIFIFLFPYFLLQWRYKRQNTAVYIYIPLLSSGLVNQNNDQTDARREGQALWEMDWQSTPVYIPYEMLLSQNNVLVSYSFLHEKKWTNEYNYPWSIMRSWMNATTGFNFIRWSLV